MQCTWHLSQQTLVPPREIYGTMIDVNNGNKIPTPTIIVTNQTDDTGETLGGEHGSDDQPLIQGPVFLS